MGTFRFAPIFKLALYCHQHNFIRTAVNCVRNAVDLSYQVLGKSEKGNALPILLFHGLLAGKRHFVRLGTKISALAKRKVIVVDLRNHGSSPHTKDHNYVALAGDVIKLYDTLNIDKASLLGHSMGGRCGIAVSLTAPEKVASLAIIDTSPVSSCYWLTVTMRKYLDHMATIDFKGAKDVKKTREEVFKKLEPLVPEEPILKAILSNVNIRPDGTIGYLVNLDSLRKNFNHIAYFPTEMTCKTYDGPTLIVKGTLSEFIPAEDLPEIFTIFPRAKMECVEAGHIVHVEKRQQFIDLTSTFLRDN